MINYKILFTIIAITCFAFSQSVDIKDGDSNSLITVNDEGTTGSITLPSGSAPGAPVSKLYNEGGTLKWNGSVLSTGSSLWSLNSGNVYRSTGNVGIGTINPSYKLDIYTTGASVIKINASNPIVDFQNNGVWHTYLQAHTNNFYLTNRLSDGNIFFGTNSVTRMTIDHEGDVGIGTSAPDATLDVSGDVVLGENGTRFLEIQEISDVTTSSMQDIYSDKLPVGWTGENTRVLSFEIRETNSPTSNWISVGNDSGASVEFRLEHSTRTVWIIQNGTPPLNGKAWRMIIMRMP